MAVASRHPDVWNAMSERLRSDPNDADALFVLAAFRATEGRFDESIGVIDRLVAINPRYPGLWRLKAKVYVLSGDPAKAEACEERADAEEG